MKNKRYHKQLEAAATQLIRISKNSYRYAVEPTQTEANKMLEDIGILEGIMTAMKASINEEKNNLT